MENTQSVALYGGALSVSLPTDFRDLSDIMPVSDNQEVFSDLKYDAKLIIEVIECLDPNDETAIQSNFNEVWSHNNFTLLIELNLDFLTFLYS